METSKNTSFWGGFGETWNLKIWDRRDMTGNLGNPMQTLMSVYMFVSGLTALVLSLFIMIRSLRLPPQARKNEALLFKYRHALIDTVYELGNAKTQFNVDRDVDWHVGRVGMIKGSIIALIKESEPEYGEKLQIYND